MVSNEGPVMVIIKDPTQQIDKTVECEMSWTIERLKEHICSVYPNKPKPADQRLVYYGHLLADKETLREIFTRFDYGETVHTVHLFCMQQAANVTTTAPEPADPQQAVPASPEDAYRFVTNSPGYQPWMNDVNGGYLQQLAWAQHYAYTHYFNQYMDMLARQNGGQPMYAVPGGEREAPRPAEPVPERAEDEDRNQDWLDYFYMFARLAILMSFVFLNASLPRFLVVSFIAIVIYLYQIGFFRVNHLPALENNNQVADNNNIVNDEAREEANEPAQPTPVPADAVVERPSVLSLTWIFFTSFFASLFPEHQNAV